MELLDRYLQAVKKHLPWKRQDDILAELRANLEAQLEDKEAALGRPLTQGETEDWLRQIGPPIRVAARYQPQQCLIGPALFPSFLFVLRTVFFWTAIIYTIASVALLATGSVSETRVLAAVLHAPGFFMQVAAWVTLIFAVIEFAATHYPAKCPAIAGVTAEWSPATLPPLEKEDAAGKKPRSFAHAVAEVVFGFLFLIWLLLIRRYPYLLLGPVPFYLHGQGRYVSPFLLAPVWVQFYWCVVALSVLQLAWPLGGPGSWSVAEAAARAAYRDERLQPDSAGAARHRPRSDIYHAPASRAGPGALWQDSGLVQQVIPPDRAASLRHRRSQPGLGDCADEHGCLSQARGGVAVRDL
jgi:hypothetical protein